MKGHISKEEILNTCLVKQEELIENFDSRVTEMKADAYSHSESASQTENRTAGKIELLSTLENEKGFAQAELGYLKSLNIKKESTIVEPGAVVITNLRTFFIAVSSEKIEIDGQVIFGISTGAPIYSVMEGLSKGDKYEFNGTAYEIEDVY